MQMKESNKYYYLNINFLVQESNVSDGTLLDNDTIADLLAQVSFPPSYTSSFPNNVEYTIYTQEYAIYPDCN